MNKEKISKVHYWIRQLRRPLCMIMVFVIVFCYGFVSNAEVVIGEEIGIKEMFNIASDTTSITPLTMNNIQSNYSAKLNDWSKVNGAGRNFIGNNGNATVINNYISNDKSLVNNISLGGVEYNLSDFYKIILCPTSGYNAFMYVGGGSGNIALVNGYLVSDAPFYYIMIQDRGYWYIRENNVNDHGSITSVSSNGYYVFDLYSKFNSYSNYTVLSDINIYFSTSDGSSGYTNFSIDSTDFNFDSDNYNFNFLKTEGKIKGSADPEPIPDSNGIVEYAKSRMNFGMSSQYLGGKRLNNSIHRLRINYPQVMRNNPELFTVKGSYTAAMTIEGEGTYQYEYNRSLIVTGPRAVGMSYIDAPIDFTGFVRTDGSGRTLWQDYLYAVHVVTGVSEQQIEANGLWENYIKVIGDVVSLISGNENPLGYLVPEMVNTVKQLEIRGDIWIGVNGNDETYDSGHNITKHDFITGDYDILSSENTINQYPAEGQDPYQLPAVGNDSGNQLPTYGGNGNNYAYGGQGGTVIVNPEQVPYTMDMGEYGSMADLFNAIRDSLQYGSGDSNVVTAGNDKVNNNFMYLIEGVYGMLPPNIWHLITISISIISGVAVVKFVRNKH